MGKDYPADIIPDFGAPFPPGAALVRIETLDDSEVTSTGKYQIKATLRGLEPTDIQDQPHFERFVIGRNEDPDADDPQSWKGIAAQRYRDMLLKAGINPTGNIDKDNAEATGQIVGVVMENEVQSNVNRDGTPNPYGGRVNARIRTFFRQGEKAVGGDGAAPVAAAAAPGVATPKPAKLQAVPAAPPQAATAAAKPAATVPKAATVKCSICNQLVARAGFAAHVEAHEANEE